MFEGILGIKKAIFGLDIGYSTMKVVQVKGSGANARFLGAAEIDIENNSITKEGIPNKEKLAQTIVQVVQAAKPHHISAKIVSSALPESLVFTKTIELPNMTEKEINSNIPGQAADLFPVPIDEIYMDWQILENSEHNNKIDVFVVAAPKALVDSLIETVKIAGFELGGARN